MSVMKFLIFDIIAQYSINIPLRVRLAGPFLTSSVRRAPLGIRVTSIIGYFLIGCATCSAQWGNLTTFSYFFIFCTIALYDIIFSLRVRRTLSSPTSSVRHAPLVGELEDASCFNQYCIIFLVGCATCSAQWGNRVLHSIIFSVQYYFSIECATNSTVLYFFLIECSTVLHFNLIECTIRYVYIIILFIINISIISSGLQCDRHSFVNGFLCLLCALFFSFSSSLRIKLCFQFMFINLCDLRHLVLYFSLIEYVSRYAYIIILSTISISLITSRLLCVRYNLVNGFLRIPCVLLSSFFAHSQLVYALAIMFMLAAP